MNSASPSENQFLELVALHRPRILRLCGVYATTARDQETLCRQVFRQLWRAWPERKDATPAPTWLCRVALNAAIAFGRKHAPPVAPAGALAPPPVPGENGGPAARLREGIARLDHLEKALATLYLEGLSYSEIASVMGLSDGSVGVLLHRLKKKLEPLLPEVTP